MKARGVFITGTDTGVGKTWTTLVIMEAFKARGRETLGMKPIASGAVLSSGELINDDAQLIKQHCSQPTDYKLINPIVYEAPMAPIFASKLEGRSFDIDQIRSSYTQLATRCENIVVEGVGGWRVPLSENISTLDLVRDLSLPVVLVVGLRLGCINHALLTAEAIRADGVNLCAWVSSQVEKDYLNKELTINLLNERLACPNIANLPYMEALDPVKMTDKIDTAFIIAQTS